MNKAAIVIDIGFGDGGKGLVVDNLCAENGNGLVVRFSGGQQCGHTVMDGVNKHVFSSYGSGSLLGCPTFSTEDTTMYLPALINEYDKLVSLGIKPRLTYHPLAMVTTPFDVAFNRTSESTIEKHGSCGLGVGATMKRSIESPYKLFVQDFQFESFFNQRMQSIGRYYTNLAESRGPAFMEEYWLRLGDVYPTFMDAMRRHAKCNEFFDIGTFDSLIGFKRNIVFEGSQGVMLDAEHGVFPNVTYANTTCRNAMKYIKKWNLIPEMWYVTRCYTTRHGQGWMPSEPQVDLVSNNEEINVFNQWQENLRIADVSYDMLNHSLRIDRNYHDECNITKNLVVTCLDQRPDFKFDFSRILGVHNFITNDSPIRGNSKKYE